MKPRPDRWTHVMSKTIDQTGPGWHAPDPELREIESLLSSYVRRQAVPPGLARRVYSASVPLLPGRRAKTEALRLTPVNLGSIWGRLALAASIRLAFVIGARVMITSPRPQPLLTPEVELVLAEYAGATDHLLADMAEFGQVEHLLVTRDMTFNDLTTDLAALAADLEM